ncbi:hypothetical protein [Dactylosporangium sp. CA-092794]|uniref:hypothetical protein n=1 Tax=Dactylosporangium sp. CA-092794 TaxID=3239929 RepID=UPI003D8FB25D
MLLDLAKVLNVEVEALTGQPWQYAPSGSPLVDGLDDVRRFFGRYDSLLGVVSDDQVDVVDVRQRVNAAHRAYQAAEYERVVQDLPALLSLADPLRSTASGGRRRDALASYVNAYAMAAKLLTKMGAADLALLSADRAASAAVDADSAESRGVAAYQVVCALLRADRAEDAEGLAVQMAEVMEREARPEEPVVVSVAGALWLIAAVIAGRRTDRGEAWRRLNQAETLATMLGQDGNFAWTAFGPTNVAIHRVSVAAELGDPAEAIRAAEAVDPERLPVGLNSRRAQVHLDLAWAQVQRKRDADALLHLMEAERTVPEMIRYNVMARELVREMLARQKRSTTSALHRLAVRAGVLD